MSSSEQASPPAAAAPATQAAAPAAPPAGGSGLAETAAAEVTRQLALAQQRADALEKELKERDARALAKHQEEYRPKLNDYVEFKKAGYPDGKVPEHKMKEWETAFLHPDAKDYADDLYSLMKEARAVQTELAASKANLEKERQAKEEALKKATVESERNAQISNTLLNAGRNSSFRSAVNDEAQAQPAAAASAAPLTTELNAGLNNGSRLSRMLEDTKKGVFIPAVRPTDVEMGVLEQRGFSERHTVLNASKTGQPSATDQYFGRASNAPKEYQPIPEGFYVPQETYDTVQKNLPRDPSYADGTPNSARNIPELQPLYWFAHKQNIVANGRDNARYLKNLSVKVEDVK